MFRERGIIRSTRVVSEIRKIDETELGDWRSPIMKILREEDLGVDKQQQQKFKRIAPQYSIIDGNLYRWSLYKLLLLCLNAGMQTTHFEKYMKGSVKTIQK